MSTPPPNDAERPPSRPIDQQQHPSAPIPGSNWRKTGSLGRGDTPTSELPLLNRYSPTPRYDLTTVSEFVGVRPVTLLSWEQNLGVPIPNPLAEPGSSIRYSERDLIAIIWLRDQIVAGVDPIAVSQRLRAVLGVVVDPTPSVPLGSARTPSRPLSTSRSLRGPGDPPSQPISRPWRNPNDPMSQPIARPTPSRSLDGSRGMAGAVAPGGRAVSSDPRSNIQFLVRALSMLDVNGATQVLDDAFTNQSVETICQTLIVPTLQRLQELNVRKEMTQPSLLFAINLIKGRLFRLFDVVHEYRDAPLTFVACGPSEDQDLDALMLALFWRRAGLRVVYFGQSVDGQALVEEAKVARPRAIGLTISSTARLRLVTRMARSLERLHPPQAQLVLVGTGLAHYTRDQLRHVGGIYLGATPGDATQQLRQVLRP